MSCPHLTPALLSEAAEVVLTRRRGEARGNAIVQCEMECIHCRAVGSLQDVQFIQHCLDARHYLCVRTQAPYELYCGYCGDFRYSEQFDEQIGQKRKALISQQTLSQPPPRQRVLPPWRASRGICNMGATCFMGSVLQVIIHNPILRSSRQMQMPAEGSSRIDCKKAALSNTKDANVNAVGNSSISTAVSMGATLMDEIASLSTMPAAVDLVGGSGQVGASGGGNPMSFAVPSTSEGAALVPGFVDGVQSGIGANGTGSISFDASQLSAFYGQTTQPSAPSSSAFSPAPPLALPIAPPAPPSITDGCIACEMRLLFDEVADDPKKRTASVIPSNLLYSVWSFADYMAGYDQQDAHEFLIALLDGWDSHWLQFHDAAHRVREQAEIMLDTSGGANGEFAGPGAATGVVCAARLDAKVKTVNSGTEQQPRCLASTSQASHVAIANETMEVEGPSNSNPPPPSPPSPSMQPTGGIINDVFSGLLRSDIVCMSCGHESFKHEPFLDISLSLHVGSKSELSPPLSWGPALLAQTTPISPLPSLSAPIGAADFTDGARARASSMEVVHGDAGARAASVSFSSPVTGTPSAGLDRDKDRDRDRDRDRERVRESRGLSLEDCLRHYTAVETLTEAVLCVRCGQPQPSQKRLTLETTPPVLALHLKRFDAISQRKICTRVNFSITDLDLLPFTTPKSRHNHNHSHAASCSFSNPITGGSGSESGSVTEISGTSSASQNERERLELERYDLQGLITHKGTLNQGHYIAYVLGHTRASASAMGGGTDGATGSGSGSGSASGSGSVKAGTGSGAAIGTIAGPNSGEPGRPTGFTKQWLRCDDESVTPVSQAEVQAAEAYILFYVKQSLLHC